MDGKNYIVKKKYCKNCGALLNEGEELCSFCGVYVGSGNRYCEKCGAETAATASFCTNCGVALNNRQAYGNPATGTPVSEEATAKVQPRNIVVAIILTLVTCGIYGIYWFIVLTDEINLLTDNKKGLSGILSFVLTLVTCGIYSYVWAFLMGQSVDKLNGNKGYSGIIYIVLLLFGLGIINYFLIQDSINNAVENR